MSAPTSTPGSGLDAAWARDFVVLAAVWGASFLFMRVAVVDFGPLATAAMRVAIGAAFLWPVMVWRGHAATLQRHWKPVLLVGVLNSGLPFVLFAFALMTISTGLSAILNASVPMFGALVAWLWLRDRLSLWRGVGLALGFGGVVLLAWDQTGFKGGAAGLAPLWAVLACLGACVSYAFAASFTRLHLGQVPPLVTAAGSQLGATLALAVPAALTWPAHPPGTLAWLAVLAVGVLCTGVAYLLFYGLIARAGPARTLSVTYLIPLFAVTYGVLLLDEHVTPGMLAGAAIILLGTALSTGRLQPGRGPASDAPQA